MSPSPSMGKRQGAWFHAGTGMERKQIYATTLNCWKSSLNQTYLILQPLWPPASDFPHHKGWQRWALGRVYPKLVHSGKRMDLLSSPWFLLHFIIPVPPFVNIKYWILLAYWKTCICLPRIKEKRHLHDSWFKWSTWDNLEWPVKRVSIWGSLPWVGLWPMSMLWWVVFIMLIDTELSRPVGMASFSRQVVLNCVKAEKKSCAQVRERACIHVFSLLLTKSDIASYLKPPPWWLPCNDVLYPGRVNENKPYLP